VLQGTCTACVVVGVSIFASEPGPRAAAPAPTTSPRTAPGTAKGASLADPQLVTAFLGGAASDIAAVTTYDYRSLDDALNAGLAVTTDPYRSAYQEALNGPLGDTALREHVVHTFNVLGIGIGTINAAGTVAKVLVFGQQEVTDDSTGGQPQDSPITLCATIHRDGDRYLISNLAEGGNAGLPPGGPDLPVAAEAGRSEVVNLLNYRRADFDADLQRALSGATGPLRLQVQRNAAATHAAMIKGNYDLTGSVTSIGVLRADANSVTLLVAADATRVADGASAPVATYPRYEVTVVRTADGWATSRVRPVDGT
jgi:hypothetical protein